MPEIIATQRLFLTADDRVVAEDDLDAVSLLVGAGCAVQPEVDAKYGLQASGLASTDLRFLPANADPVRLGSSHYGEYGTGDQMRLGVDTTDPAVLNGANYVGTSAELEHMEAVKRQAKLTHTEQRKIGILQEYRQAGEEPVITVAHPVGPSAGEEKPYQAYITEAQNLQEGVTGVTTAPNQAELSEQVEAGTGPVPAAAATRPENAADGTESSEDSETLAEAEDPGATDEAGRVRGAGDDESKARGSTENKARAAAANRARGAQETK